MNRLFSSALRKARAGSCPENHQFISGEQGSRVCWRRESHATMAFLILMVSMSVQIPPIFSEALKSAHPSWQASLSAGLDAVAHANSAYLQQLANEDFLPENGRLFAAFSQPLDDVRFVLVGEGPFPRAESATGFCFMDGAVNELWSAKGLSKTVNRATSLRNFMKMLLVADGQLSPAKTGGEAVVPIAAQVLAGDSGMIQTREELQHNLLRQGFLLLNATLVYRAHVSPAKESKAWQPFLKIVLQTIVARATQVNQPISTLVLWGKVAEKLAQMPLLDRFPKAVSEHPYNLSFIRNSQMQDLFRPLNLLQKQS